MFRAIRFRIAWDATSAINLHAPRGHYGAMAALTLIIYLCGFRIVRDAEAPCLAFMFDDR